MYSVRVLEHFGEPRHAGELPDANLRTMVENPVCGDVLELSARVSEGCLREVRFRAKGCVPLVAAASIFCEWAQGRSFTEIEALDAGTLSTLIGELPQASRHVLDVTLQASQKLLSRPEKPL